MSLRHEKSGEVDRPVVILYLSSMQDKEIMQIHRLSFVNALLSKGADSSGSINDGAFDRI